MLKIKESKTYIGETYIEAEGGGEVMVMNRSAAIDHNGAVSYSNYTQDGALAEQNIKTVRQETAEFLTQIATIVIEEKE